MKRTLLLLPAIALAIFGTLLALDVINFEAEAADRWVMIFSFAGAAAFIGLGISDSSHDTDEAAATGRAAAARKLNETTELPAKPGSLLKQAAVVPDSGSPLDKRRVPSAEKAVDPIRTELVEADAIASAEPLHDLPVAVPEPEPTLDPVDAELQSLIDDDQMQEITDLIEADSATTDSVATDSATADDTTIDLNEIEEASAVVPGSESVEPLARLELRLADYDDDDLQRVVKESESVVIAEMVRSGQLTSDGPLTERDIASMVFLAYTSEEMLTDLRLRKSMDQDQPGIEASTGNDFAPLKNIE